MPTKKLPWATGFEAGTKEVLDFTESQLSISTSSPRTGTYCASASWTSASSVGYVSLTTGASELWIGFGYKTPTKSGTDYVVHWNAGGTNLGYLTIGSDMLLRAYRSGGTLYGTGSTAIVASTWCSIVVHIKIDDAGVCQVYLDGVNQIDYSGDTKPGADTTITRVLLGNTQYGNPTVWDDMWISETFLSYDIRIGYLIPDSDGDYEEWVPLSGVDSWEMINERPHDSDTTYISSGTTGCSTLVNLPDFTSLGPLKGINVVGTVKAASGSGDKIRLIIKTSGSTYYGDDQAVSTSYAVYNQFWKNNPDDSAAWEEADIDALQIGIEDRS